MRGIQSWIRLWGTTSYLQQDCERSYTLLSTVYSGKNAWIVQGGLLFNPLISFLRCLTTSLSITSSRATTHSDWPHKLSQLSWPLNQAFKALPIKTFVDIVCHAKYASYNSAYSSGVHSEAGFCTPYLANCISHVALKSSIVAVLNVFAWLHKSTKLSHI